MLTAVAASTFGRVVIAAGAEQLGGYPPILHLLLAVPTAAAMAALLKREPVRDAGLRVETGPTA